MDIDLSYCLLYYLIVGVSNISTFNGLSVYIQTFFVGLFQRVEY